MKLDLNSKLALFAVILGFIAIFGGNPQTSGRITIDTTELTSQINSEEHNVCVKDLADWIIKQKADFRLIDLRDESSYSEYHIPLAENIKVADFNDLDMPRNEKYILISDSDILTGQAWSLLKARRYKAVYVIKGGIETWKDKILFPKLAADASSEDISEFEKIKAVSKFFGGIPQTGTTVSEDTQIEMPKLNMPVQVKVQRKKKLQKEGC